MQKNPEKAIDQLKLALKLRPAWANAHYRLGTIFKAQRRLNHAVNSYRKAVQSAVGELQANAYNDLAICLKEQDKLLDAEEACRRSLSAVPDAWETQNILGTILQERQSRLEEAAQAFSKAIRLNPKQGVPYCNLGQLLFKQGKLQASLQAYKTALKLNPDLVQAEFCICMRQLPIIYGSTEEIEARRQRYQEQLKQLFQSSKNKPDCAYGSNAVGFVQPYYLAYQTKNDRELQKIYGDLIVRIMSSRYPQWSQPPD
ncbi:MAG: tetratricopeptide repeat protein [Leptolyngbyaceae cyanobacterium]